MTIEEVDKLRGHSFLPPQNELGAIPALYETDGVKLDEKIVWLHFFVGACDWWLFELKRDDLLAFGYCDLGDPQNAEMGYFSLRELGSILVDQRIITGSGIGTLQVPVERELSWKPCRFSEVDRM